jgi:hypothetical protein
MKVIFVRFTGYELSWGSLRIMNRETVYKIASTVPTYFRLYKIKKKYFYFLFNLVTCIWHYLIDNIYRMYDLYIMRINIAVATKRNITNVLWRRLLDVM